MYFPYFYGRQVELLALRDVATDLAGRGVITPIIEPVMSKPGNLTTCLAKLQETGASLYLIVNPSQGELSSGVPENWRQNVSKVVAEDKAVFPTHQISTQADVAALPGFCEQFRDRRTGVVLRQPHIAPIDLAAQISDHDAIVFVHASADPRVYLQGLPPDKCIEIVPSFTEQARNADYGAPEWFTSSHLQFTKDGRSGFSDFGPLSRTFSLTGGRAGAVAIHLTYPHRDRSLWIQHFVSDTTDRDEGDVASKIAEAVAKLAAEVEENPDRFVETQGIRAYLANQVLNLPINKRQQIIHHLATIADVLTENSTQDLD